MMKVKFDIAVKNYHGGPNIRIYMGDRLLKSTILSKSGPQSIEIDTDVICPTKLIIEHHGKDMRRDTKLEEGRIVDDKGFTLHKVYIGDIILQNELYLFDFIKEDGTILKNSNYIGYNGRYIIDIEHDNIITWYVKLQQTFTNHLPPFDYEQFKREILEAETYEVTY